MASEENVPFDPTSFEHIPVLLNECLEGLAIDPAGTYLDGTAGGAGHSRQIALRLDAAKGGRLISLDQDPDAVQTARARLAGLPATVVQINFRYAGQALEELGIDKINGALLDLGVSSHQLDDAARGFSYRADAPLDMRMSQQGETAADLVNTLSREDLARILRDYGEEPFAWQIAGKIEEARENAPIETTLQLADIVASAMPPAERRKNKNPSRRTFQALRIAVNHELDALEEGLDTIFEHLAPGGRLCVITFHSLEDRLVKNKFRRWATACTCPPEFPVCVCGGKAKAKLITRKPIEANTQELEENRRSRRCVCAAARPRQSSLPANPLKPTRRSWKKTGAAGRLICVCWKSAEGCRRHPVRRRGNHGSGSIRLQHRAAQKSAADTAQDRIARGKGRQAPSFAAAGSAAQCHASGGGSPAHRVCHQPADERGPAGGAE